jgi:hypothetical protein
LCTKTQSRASWVIKDPEGRCHGEFQGIVLEVSWRDDEILMQRNGGILLRFETVTVRIQVYGIADIPTCSIFKYEFI